jgi:cytochrome P450
MSLTAPAAPSAPPCYVPGGGEAWRSPWAGYAALRDHDPVHQVVPEAHPEHDFYVLTRHADVLAAAVDTTTFSSAHGLSERYDELEALGLTDSPPMVMQDPPVHSEFRRLVSRGFTPRQVTELEPAVRAFVVERVEALAARGGGDIVAEIFKPLPSMVVAHYLGVPSEDRQRFDNWTDAIVTAGAAGSVLEAADAVGALMSYFSELIQRRRVEPGHDTVSELVSAGVGDDDAGLIAILGYVFTMVNGGNDTTTGALGGAVQLLSERPEQRALLVDQPDLIGPAVEEVLRLTSPVQVLGRTTTRDVDLHGVRIPAGRKVMLHYGAGNRDPRRYGPDADDLDVIRRPSQILTFGQGAHHCLGNAAARLQIRVALEEVLARVPRFVVDPLQTTWAPGPYVRRPTSVPMTVPA